MAKRFRIANRIGETGIRSNTQETDVSCQPPLQVVARSNWIEVARQAPAVH
jgi:hypothetical protein